MQQTTEKGTPINCDCGKLIAFERNGRIYVKCQRCKREVEVTQLVELRTQEVRSH